VKELFAREVEPSLFALDLLNDHHLYLDKKFPMPYLSERLRRLLLLYKTLGGTADALTIVTMIRKLSEHPCRQRGVPDQDQETTRTYVFCSTLTILSPTIYHLQRTIHDVAPSAETTGSGCTFAWYGMFMRMRVWN
jgi:hypothetical protein